MIGAGETAFLDPAIGKRSAAMGTTVFEKTDFSLRSFKQHQVLTENSNEFGRVLSREVRRNGNRMPVTP